MNGNEIKEATIEDAIYCAKAMACLEVCEECRLYGLCHTWCDDVYGIMIEALEELQQYRAISTVESLKDLPAICDSLAESSEKAEKLIEELQAYRAIGTIEGFKALKEKNEPKELAEHNFQDEVHYYLCPSCRSIVSCTQNYCDECGQALET